MFKYLERFKYEKKRCELCGNWLQKWGKHRNGKKRYRCSECGLNSTGGFEQTIKNARFKLFNDWLLGNKSISEIAREQGVHRMTLYRWFLQFKNHPSKQKHIDISDQVVIIDGTYLGKNIVVLVVRTTIQVVTWKFCTKECEETWIKTLRTLKSPKAVVCDGQKGMIAAVRYTFDDVIIQRCLFHVQSYCLTKLTKKPANVVDQKLRSICVNICRISTIEERSTWLESYIVWKWQHEKYLKAKISYLHPINDTLVTKFAHQKTRKIVTAIDNALPNMFHYLHHPDIPRTTNHIEGGTNSRLKELIHRHRGLTTKGKIILTNEYLRKGQETS